MRGELLGKTSTEGASREWGVGEGCLKRETKEVERDREEQTWFPREAIFPDGGYCFQAMVDGAGSQTFRWPPNNLPHW